MVQDSGEVRSRVLISFGALPIRDARIRIVILACIFVPESMPGKIQIRIREAIDGDRAIGRRLGSGVRARGAKVSSIGLEVGQVAKRVCQLGMVRGGVD